jgi:hypothetical protein
MGSKNSARSKKTVAALAAAVACAAAAVFLIAARKPTQPQPMAAAEAQPEIAALPVEAPTSVSATPAPAKKTPAKKAPAERAASATNAPSTAKTESAAGSPATIATYEGPAKTTQIVESARQVPVQESNVKMALPPPSPVVTIAGCLERDGGTFRLKDTSGLDAPKSRSWKSGFLKKGTPRIELLDAANQLKLRDHVGQRVSVTGTLVDREMQARSLRSVSTSCK